MTTQTTTSLKVSRHINADPDTVFRAWTEPGQLRKWSSPGDISVAVAEVHLKVGGQYRIGMRSPEGAPHTAVGVYREIDRPRRLRYTWRWEEAGADVGETLVTVDFLKVKEGTEVTITHELFPSEEAKNGHEEGWGGCLNKLEALFA